MSSDFQHYSFTIWSLTEMSFAYKFVEDARFMITYYMSSQKPHVKGKTLSLNHNMNKSNTKSKLLRRQLRLPPSHIFYWGRCTKVQINIKTYGRHRFSCKSPFYNMLISCGQTSTRFYLLIKWYNTIMSLIKFFFFLPLAPRKFTSQLQKYPVRR